ncbi:hypothetical protein I545_1750 [Mycobacterium kansasii 662]|uniref:Uncharacterized protein n=2 Tax=Mycobacterium kansasii TaxID=1768 RepID=A0A1V3XHJ0_MYCKA|nr:hypothetical protein I545_1750 [Mycobacterium kansasii 662]KEP39734.1 hypothetical protein MKSMC1_50840 [Mycobacterium kansasii]OOK78622.1 hypothetical protein BZL30_2657 [Mycobacterium kansasii]
MRHRRARIPALVLRHIFRLIVSRTAQMPSSSVSAVVTLVDARSCFGPCIAALTAVSKTA